MWSSLCMWLLGSLTGRPIFKLKCCLLGLVLRPCSKLRCWWAFNFCSQRCWVGQVGFLGVWAPNFWKTTGLSVSHYMGQFSFLMLVFLWKPLLPFFLRVNLDCTAIGWRDELGLDPNHWNMFSLTLEAWMPCGPLSRSTLKKIDLRASALYCSILQRFWVSFHILLKFLIIKGCYGRQLLIRVIKSKDINSIKGSHLVCHKDVRIINFVFHESVFSISDIFFNV